MDENPDAGTKLFMDEISFTIVDEFGLPDDDITAWFNHLHGNSFHGRFAFGDLSGEDNGDLDIAISMGYEAVMAGRIAIDTATNTGTITPIFMYLSDEMANLVGVGTPSQPAQLPAGHSQGDLGSNVLIADFDGDGKNEVAAQMANTNGGIYLVLLQEDPNALPSKFGYSAPEPAVLAQVLPATPDLLQERMGTCRLDDTGYMIVTHDHNTHNDFRVWSYSAPAPGSGSNQPVLEVAFKTAIGAGTENSDEIKTHEFNYVDVDGDGLDEFFLNGVIDFVDRDANGDIYYTNSQDSMLGKAVWTSGMVPSNPGPHMDQMMVADWDPLHPGLELFAATDIKDGGTTFFFDGPDCTGGTTQIGLSESYEILYDADDGTVLAVNAGGCDPAAPSPDGQVVIGGNFTAHPHISQGVDPGGLEAILVPKNLGDNDTSVSPPADSARIGSYMVDYEMNELVVDGINFFKKVQNPYYPSDPAPGIFVTGPGREQISCMDWDGDRTQDEIYCLARRLLTVFRLGLKGDWSTYPDFLPNQGHLLDGGGDVKPFQFESDPLDHDYFIHYYQGSPLSWAGVGTDQPNWAWNFGGPGRFTHYYEKLGHVWPHADQFVATPYDLCGDHREEIAVLNENGFFVYQNDDALTAPLRASPRLLTEYRHWRQEPVPFPFDWQGLPFLVDLEVRPADASLPTRVVGMGKRNGPMQLKAIAHYSDGREVDVTNAVTWIPDSDTDAYLTLSSTGLLAPQNEIVSARVRAQLGSKLSNTLYVQATSETAPVIVMAGYDKTYLDKGNGAEQLLKVVAYVAQKTNDPDIVVTMVTPGQDAGGVAIPETYWEPYGQEIWLVDDGDTLVSGDEVAGDGIYTALVDPGPGLNEGLSLGDNLKFVQAALWDPSMTILGSMSFTGTAPFEKSNTWPSVVVGPVNVAITEPASPPPTATDDVEAFWGPRVLTSGTRGYGVDNDKVLLEIVVAPAAYVSDPPAVEVHTPWNGQTIVLQPQSDFIYTALIDVSGVSNGSYLVDVRANLASSAFPPYTNWRSDWSGRLYLHDAILPDTD